MRDTVIDRKGKDLEVLTILNGYEDLTILNGYEDIDRNIFFSHRKDSRTRGHEVTLVKDQDRLDIKIK